MRGRGIRTRAAIAMVATLLAIATALLASGPAGGAQGGGVYIALGDSYTSGPLIPLQHGNPIDCGRSDHNYPSLVAAALQPATFVDVSCGSAQTKDMTEPQTGLPLGGTNPPQFNALRPDATLVTVGIGGNDAGLVSVATMCAQLGLTDPTGTACRDRYAPGGNDTVGAKIEQARPKIDAVLQGIDQRSPTARVAIVGYPNVLPIDGTNCYPTVPLSRDDVRYIDELIRRINLMISEEAAKNDAEFVDTYDDSIGHDVCKLPPTRWFEGLIPTEPAYPLHPNGKGEASMARSAIAVLSKPAPVASKPARVSKLRVRPNRVRGGRVMITFRFSRDATVRLSRRRAGGGKYRRISKPITGHAGANRIRIRARKLGRHRGQYQLRAQVVTADGAGAKLGRAHYRVLAKRGR